MPIATSVRGLISTQVGWQGQSPKDLKTDALQPVDSIDLIIVGLGLVLVLLALLRR